MDELEWKLTIEAGQKGGPGSGHHGHAGRPGQRGGSAPGKGEGGRVAGGSVALSLDEVTEKIQSRVPKGQTYRGISKHRFDAMSEGQPLISVGAEMLPQAGKRGELQTTNHLMQALAHAENGVLIAIPKRLTAAKRQFADIRRVKAGKLTLNDVTVAFDAETGEVIYEA